MKNGEIETYTGVERMTVPMAASAEARESRERHLAHGCGKQLAKLIQEAAVGPGARGGFVVHVRREVRRPEPYDPDRAYLDSEITYRMDVTREDDVGVLLRKYEAALHQIKMLERENDGLRIAARGSPFMQ